MDIYFSFIYSCIFFNLSSFLETNGYISLLCYISLLGTYIIFTGLYFLNRRYQYFIFLYLYWTNNESLSLGGYVSHSFFYNSALIFYVFFWRLCNPWSYFLYILIFISLIGTLIFTSLFSLL